METTRIDVTIQNMKEFHAKWNQKLVEMNIFRQPVSTPNFQIKYGVKSYNGKWVPKTNTIILYPIQLSMDIKWFQNILVHEMLHQYITENKIIDTSAHGLQWKSLAAMTNRYFNELHIQTTDTRERVGEGYEIFKILVCTFANNMMFASVIHPSKIGYFNEKIMTNKINWKYPLCKFGWFESKNRYFEGQRKSISRLTGTVIPINEMCNFIEKYNMKRIQVVEEL